MLTAAIDRYLELRRALGHKLQTSEVMLRSFARYARTRGETHITGSSALAWAALTPTARQRAKRLTVIIGLARFLHAEDPRHEIPPRALACPTPPRPLPYIFSAEEIRRLAHAANQLPPRRTLRPLTFSTLFSLLAVTGLRISEALELRIDDFTRDGLIVRETKFHKSRLVPLHESTAAALTRYLERRQQLTTYTDHIFVSLGRTPICYATAYRTFRLLCANIGLPSSPRVRLHDLRHTVAVRALEACPEGRDQVTPHILALSTYLGHASLRGTYWYLQTTPQLLYDIAGAAEDWMNGGPR
ncbi:MAG TPA: tyrosine-type recombinase/integrase [Xanthobacteraceae bacterium]|jgi:integrase